MSTEPEHERALAEALAAQLHAIAHGQAADTATRGRIAGLKDEELRREIALLKIRARQSCAAHHASSSQALHTLTALQARAGLPSTLSVEALRDELEGRFGLQIADDGLLESERITERLHWVGDLPFALYHHTSTALLERIRAQGLIVGKQTNFFNTQAGVYVSTIRAGRPVSTYSACAARVHGGWPTTLRVARRLTEIQPDPDDADLDWAQGRQFITPYVPPDDIRWDRVDSRDAAHDSVQEALQGMLPLQRSTSG